MQKILIDTSVLLDLVLYHQERHRRNRSVASSAAAAIESVLIYENALIDGAAFDGILQAGAESRFWKFYCDDQAGAAMSQFHQLGAMCQPLTISAAEHAAISEQALCNLENCLATIADPEGLRAYELYDYLPYHLGEDPTAIECRVANPSVADLELVDAGKDRAANSILVQAAAALRERRHPTRAAWALPLLRFFYYEAIQEVRGVHFVPHATKSTIAFGREAETVDYRRLLDYCTDEFRSSYLSHAQRLLGGLMIVAPLPAFAEMLLHKTSRWADLMTLISRLREDLAMIAYRKSLAALIGEFERLDSLEGARPVVEAAYLELESQARRLAARLGGEDRSRRVRLALPFQDFGKIGRQANGGHTLLFIHDLFSATGIAAP